MSTPTLLNTKLTEFSEWITNLNELDNETIKQYRNEIKQKGRTFIKFQAEVKLLNDDDLISKFSDLMIQFKTVKAIANGHDPPAIHQETEKKAQSPEEPQSNSTKTKSCTMGKDCASTDPKHYYDFIHFDHPKSDQMIWKHEKYLKKQKCQQIYQQHSNKTNDTNTPNASAEFAQFLTDEEIAHQLQAMQDMQPSNGANPKPKKPARKRRHIVYVSEDEEDKESSAEDNDDDEDYDENEARRTYRRKVKSRKKEDEKRRAEEANMDESELQRLRQERLDKLLGKTEAYMKTLTRRVRKNFKEADTNTNHNKNTQLSTNEVRQFLEGDGAKNKAIEQTKSLIGGTLKDYQQIGLRWMVTLNQMRLNGILADEMGLGKTVQVIALLAYILDNDSIHGKHLIVCPLSTLSSWRDHFQDWLPALKVYLHRGPQAERKEKIIAINNGEYEADVVISTYQMIIRDAETLSNLKWCYLIVDEAHTLKNAQGRLFEALNAFSTKHRLLLTGTPLQNNLGELWSLLNFILPSIFDSAQSFESWFCSPYQHLNKKKDKNKAAQLSMTDTERLMVMDRLHRAIDPFLLRRMKKDVLPQMVKKEEIVIKVPISGMQSMMYSQLQKYGALRYKTEKKRSMFNNVMMQLRKCANHPYLFANAEYEIDENIYRSSGKFVLLRHLIPKMKKFDHRMLIFCQFVSTMDILSEFMDFMNEAYLRIDGGTDSEDRMQYLDEFNANKDDCAIFLLSTRACGLGLNLCSADTIILFDSDWNPQQDLQAMARCHRIGQTKEVRIFRLIADQTIEESIFDRAQNKLDLERKAIECGKFDFSISGEERKKFLTKILNERMSVNNKYSSDIERTKLNQLLSRSEEEWKTFEAMDEDEENQFLCLLTEEILPSWLEPITTKKDPEEVLPSKRRRKQMTYNDDAYWKSIEDQCVENDDDKENKNKKRKRKKRKRNECDADKDEDEGSEIKEQTRKKRRVK